jgi:hypothetical protein
MNPRWSPGPETRAAVVRHPFFLAGLAVVVLLGLTAGVLVVVDSARGGKSSPPAVVVDPVSTDTVGPTSMTATADGVTGTANDILTVRSAPGTRTPALGTLAKGDEVVIDGRTTDSNWYRIIFPPLSEFHGWVEATSLAVTGDPSTLLVATAEPPVYVEVPTTPPDVLTSVAGSLTPTEAATPEVTPTVSDQLPDLVIGTTPTVSGGKLFVTVVNQGQGDAVGDIVVAVFNPDGTKLLGGATLPNFTLKPGRSIDIGTGYEVTQSQTLLLIVDPNGDIAETDDTNNRATVAIAVGNPSPTDATPAETPPPDATVAP